MSIFTEKCFEMPKHSCQNTRECRDGCKVPMSAGRGSGCRKHCRHPIDVPTNDSGAHNLGTGGLIDAPGTHECVRRTYVLCASPRAGRRPRAAHYSAPFCRAPMETEHAVPRSGHVAMAFERDLLVFGGELPDEVVDERPLVTVSQGLDEETFQTLKAALVNHPRLQNADSEALGASFAGSSGFVVRFDGWGGVDATAKKLWVRSETRPLVPFFRRCADKECTGFVLNVLVVAPAEDDDEVVVDEDAPEAVKLLLRKKAEESIDEQYAVGWHRDATLGLKPGADAAPPLAHRVSACVKINQRVRFCSDAATEARGVGGVGRPKFDFHIGLGAVRGGAGGDGRRAVSAECGSAALAVRARRY